MSCTVKLKYLGGFQGGAGFPEREQGIRDAEFPFYKVKDLGKSELYLTETDNYVSEETAKSLGATILKPNCIVFAKVGAALLLQRFRFLSTPSCIDNNMMGFSVNKKVECRFVRYSLSQLPFSEIVNPGAVPSLNEEQIRNLEITWFPFQTQTKIANYLDRKTAELDQLIGAKQRLLKLLDEKKRALIARAVTRGLNPDVPLKDSGIPWLGMIPAHWEVKRITTLFKERDERGQPELPLLVVSIHSGVSLREFSNDKIEQQAADFNTYKVALKGDISFNKMRMWQGAVGCVPCDGLVSPDYVVAEPFEKIYSDYYGMLFKTPMFSDESACRSHGIVWDRLRLYWDEFKDISVPVPPFAEQKNIVVAVSIQQEKLNNLKSITEKTIALLQERRTALISAAVTGKLSEEVLNAG